MSIISEAQSVRCHSARHDTKKHFKSIHDLEGVEHCKTSTPRADCTCDDCYMLQRSTDGADGKATAHDYSGTCPAATASQLTHMTTLLCSTVSATRRLPGLSSFLTLSPTSDTLCKHSLTYSGTCRPAQHSGCWCTTCGCSAAPRVF